MNKSLAALASGAFALGFAEFVMMGILATVAADLGVGVPAAGNFISAYALGVCAGALILVFGRRVPPKQLLLAFLVIVIAGNTLAAASVSAGMLEVVRFISGIPHGAYFGTATLVAKLVAERGREGQAVAFMVLGQTIANTIGVPGGTLLASLVSWRATFAFVAAWSLFSLALIARWVPQLDAIPDAGLAGQFAFLKAPGPWLIIAAVLLGNTGIFSWWSYVSPFLTQIGGFTEASIPALLVLAGLGMVAGILAGGRIADIFTPGTTAAGGQLISFTALLLIAFISGSPFTAALSMWLCACGMFFVSSPQQVLMVQVGQGGGELLAGACVQIAFNGGNAIGAIVGQAVLNTGAAYNWTGLAGAPFTLLAALLLAVFAIRFEPRYRTAAAS